VKTVSAPAGTATSRQPPHAEPKRFLQTDSRCIDHAAKSTRALVLTQWVGVVSALAVRVVSGCTEEDVS
jgi:hypothetical protein